MDAHGVQHQPVARDLSAYGQHHEQRDPRASRRLAQSSEAVPPSARVAPRQPGEFGEHSEDAAEGDEWGPPGQPKGVDERE